MKMPALLSRLMRAPAMEKTRNFFSKHPILRWTLITVVVLAVAQPLLVAWITRPLPGAQGEIIQPNEDVEIAKLVSASAALATQDHDLRGDGTWRRDVHVKSAGCIRATFTAMNVPDRFRRGVLASTEKHDALIRFSNGSHQLKPDATSKDVRGIAIKIFDVPGRKLLDGEEDAVTQDFMLMSTPVYFFNDVGAYAQFSAQLPRGAETPGYHLLGSFAPSGMMGRDTFPFFRYSWIPANWNWRSFFQAFHAQVPAPPTPLHMQYYSGSAYLLGPQQYVKYSMRPCTGYMNNPPKAPAGENGLHEALKQALMPKEGAKGWCFDFMVQPQVAGKNMPVEDPSSLWSEKDSPFVTVAKIEIPPQEVPDQQCYCEYLAFNPWHSLPEHRPVGVFNRIRKAVYQESARFRRSHEGVPLREPATREEAMGVSCPAPRNTTAASKPSSTP